jgi:hypothetical protein
MNDIKKTTYKDLIDLDIQKIYILSTLVPFKSLFKKNTRDILDKKLNKINLSINPKIKILSLKRPIIDVLKTKKIASIDINNYSLKVDKNTINLLDIENFNKIS